MLGGIVEIDGLLEVLVGAGQLALPVEIDAQTGVGHEEQVGLARLLCERQGLLCQLGSGPEFPAHEMEHAEHDEGSNQLGTLAHRLTQLARSLVDPLIRP